jgi:predicted XRE-type DNA-binding protein
MPAFNQTNKKMSNQQQNDPKEEWRTNAADIGLKPSGEDSHLCTKLAAKSVLEIRKRYAAGSVSQDRLAQIFGVSQSHIGRIVRKEEWRQL